MASAHPLRRPALVFLCVCLGGCGQVAATPVEPALADTVADGDAAATAGEGLTADGADAATDATADAGSDALDGAAAPGCAPDPPPAWAPQVAATSQPPGALCAAPGWPGKAAPKPLIWKDVTAGHPIVQPGAIDSCLLWQDLTGDGIDDWLVVLQPTGPVTPRIVRLGIGAVGGTFTVEESQLSVADQVLDCAVGNLLGDKLPEIALATPNGLRLLQRSGAGYSDISATVLPAAAQTTQLHTLALVDLDGDGDLDLVLGQEVNPPMKAAQCMSADGPHWMCCQADTPPPAACVQKYAGGTGVWGCCEVALPPVVVPVLRNDGGKFVDVTAASALNVIGNTYTTAPFDIDRDGRVDVFTGNDFGNQLWFRGVKDPAYAPLGTGLGLRPYGHPMGTATGDFNGDHRADLVMTDWGASTLYQGSAAGFSDAGATSGLWPLTQDLLAWAYLAADFDNDGWLDAVAIGSIAAKKGMLPLAAAAPENNTGNSQTAGFHAMAQNLGGTFSQTALPWPAGAKPTFLGMSAATPDIDGDGDLDLVTMNPPGSITVWRNDTPLGAHWLGVELRTPVGHADGALVQVWAAGNHLQERWWYASTGFGAHGGAILHFGLGEVAQVDLVRVWWPSGQVLDVKNPAVDAILPIAPGGKP